MAPCDTAISGCCTHYPIPFSPLPDFHFWLVVSFHDLGGEILQAEGSLQCGPHGTQVGAESGSHRGRWLGRKAEVRKWPAPRRLPFREKRSRSLRPDVRTVPSMSRAGEGEARNTWHFGSFPARTAVVVLDS